MKRNDYSVGSPRLDDGETIHDHGPHRLLIIQVVFDCYQDLFRSIGRGMFHLSSWVKTGVFSQRSYVLLLFATVARLFWRFCRRVFPIFRTGGRGFS